MTPKSSNGGFPASRRASQSRRINKHDEFNAEFWLHGLEEMAGVHGRIGEVGEDDDEVDLERTAGTGGELGDVRG